MDLAVFSQEIIMIIVTIKILIIIMMMMMMMMMMIITSTSAIRDFLQLLTSVSNTYAQVARAPSCANHVQ